MSRRLQGFALLLAWSAWKTVRFQGIGMATCLAMWTYQGTLAANWMYAACAFAGGLGVCMSLTLEHSKNGSFVD